MASTFRPVNSPLTEVPKEELRTPTSTTPHPSATLHPQPPNPSTNDLPDDGTTPTRASFSASPSGQKPLPSSPFPQSALPSEPHPNRLKREGSHHSGESSRRDSMDVDMDDSDGDAGTAEDGAGSDDESVNADGSRSGKKKKSQRFYCTDYPPCNLSFTRSEHLARHIRKHTGERPFQCHCSRRFSRLDNLRQHAQTVHVNEDIPVDSLAATGSRFQRQIRTERVRQAGNRARAATGGSAGGPVRGHSKSFSTSSVTSNGSVSSAYNPPTDARRRPPPLIMATSDPRSRGSLESYRSNADSGYSYRPGSPGEFSTPTSATFSTGQSSPRWSGYATPSSSHSRSQSAYVAGSRTPGRRLSVPSGVNPFQSPNGMASGRHLFGGAPVNTSHASAFSPSDNSLVSSPTTSTASGWSSRRDSMSSTADDAWRRRTWHPDSRNYNGNPNQLSAVVTQSSVRPNPAPPIANPANSQSSLRLPGIESFDPLIQRPVTPPRRMFSPMAVDSERLVPHHASHLEMAPADDRRNLNMYDASLQRGLTRLDIGHSTPPRDSAGAWASEAHRAVQAQAEQVRLNPPTVRFEDQQPPSAYANANVGPPPSRSLHQQTMSAPSVTARDGKRHGWYNGPPAYRESGPSPAYQDPRVNQVGRMVHPNFTDFRGFPARDAPAPPPASQQPRQGQLERQQPANGEPLGRLEALVAVATGEGSTAAAY